MSGVRNDIDSLHLAGGCLRSGAKFDDAVATDAEQLIRDELIDHGAYIVEYGEDGYVTGT